MDGGSSKERTMGCSTVSACSFPYRRVTTSRSDTVWRRSWGKEIATEAVAALIGYAFRSLGLPRVVAVVYPENVASRRVLEKLGFAYDGLCNYKDVRVPRYALSAE